ncbi:hypothetical protein EG327_007879 [Venturia inaequalis]|uniref:Regulator of G protein signaling superfamily n=1 Tax=Venturia inaequalis TaxID=5025 RepID=A0A8H3UUU4_VENIN|nr:hypothetical protein EG327_007879 [Venturia inaequalis]
MSILFYKRPNYVDRPAGPLNQDDCQRFAEKTKNNKSAIPPELSFDNIINGMTLPPATLSDFMDYLIYVAHDAETLQFYLWLKDYRKRYACLRKEEQTLSPEWKAKPVEERKLTHKKSRTESSGDYLVDKESVLRMKDMSRVAKEVLDEPASPLPPGATATDYELFITKSACSQKDFQEQSDDANTSAGLKWQPFTCQPFRSEIAKITAHYFAPGGPRELNISDRDRTQLLHALQHTTHPSAFTFVETIVEAALRNQLHPNFVRWSICNGNKPKVYFVRVMGVSHTFAGLLIAILFTFSHVSRWWRVLNVPITWIGLATWIAAYKGLCVILHAKGQTRNLRPWEDLNSIYDGSSTIVRPSDEESITSPGYAQSFGKKSGMPTYAPDTKRAMSFDTFGTANTYLDEPWVERYEKKTLMQKVEDTCIWVQDDSLRLLQNKIVVGARIWATIGTLLITIFFVALPKGNLY